MRKFKLILVRDQLYRQSAVGGLVGYCSIGIH
jgi:hypothetical protein